MKPKFKSGWLGLAAVFVLGCAATLPDMSAGDIRFTGTMAQAQQAAPQQKLSGCKQPPEKRRLRSLDQKFFNKVANVDALMNPEAKDANSPPPEPNYQAAWAPLKRLLDRCDDCSDYEWAQLYQRAAVIQFNLENVPSAIDYFKRVVSKAPNIPESLETTLLYQIAQLETSEENYASALATFDKWEAMCPNIVPEDYYYFRAQVYYQLNRKDQALQAVAQAIDFKESKGEVAKEGWLRLQLAIYADREDYSSAEKVSEKLVVNYPSVSSIGQLASIYGLNGKDAKQMGMLDALNVTNGLNQEREFRNLAYLYLGVDAPYLAARVLKKGFEAEKIERTAKNLEIWAASLSQAQEVDDALPIMEEAARKSDEGKLYATLSAVYLDAEKFDDSIKAGRNALKKGDLRSEAEVYMYMGSAYLSMEKYDESIEALRKATKDERYGKHADELIKYVKKEKERDEQLRKAKLKS